MHATMFGDILPHVMNMDHIKNLAKRRKCGEKKRESYDCPEEFQTSQRLGPSMSMT